VKSWTRPDGRRFVVGEPDGDLPAGRLYATADEGDTVRLRQLEGLGFARHRREVVLRLPTDPRRWRERAAAPPGGVELRQADRVDETRLRLLDDLLRHDVPGTDGWRWDEAGFREETYASPHFDPATYLVAVDAADDYLGIARVWMRRPRPRLGFVGVRADRRRQGLARALVAAVLLEVHERGLPEVGTEVDETNTASRALLAGFDGEPVGAELELVREAAPPAR
jgi:GNAT superfamily N-acetyltransferase